ncbi:MAG: hypothetical protein OXE93_04175 [bacterium]|nr:hypothetical protein [bacterium]
MPSGQRKQRPDTSPPIFFLDRGLGRHLIAKAIRTRGYVALPMAEVYPGGADQHTPDPEWILKANQEGWVALTKDYSLARDHRDVLAGTTLRVFAYNNANLAGSDMVDRLETNFNRILQRAAKPGPYVYLIGRNTLKLCWRPPPDYS